MSKSDTFENDLLKLILQGVAIGNLADNATTGPLTNLFLSLHTADPGDAGTQTTSEITYTGYARAAVARSAAGWTVTGNVANLTAAINFPAGTAGAGTATHFALGTLATGTGKILYKGAVTPNIVTGAGITPQLGTGTTISEE